MKCTRLHRIAASPGGGLMPLENDSAQCMVRQTWRPVSEGPWGVGTGRRRSAAGPRGHGDATRDWGNHLVARSIAEGGRHS
ncbi:hypothetical protein NDU88_001225 [Pleurodeles waltl]|uniref:Uncharacterized protein n=1 Tax=Pleurodeles waltl TaxID=8319 RepID=A0AAV7NA63_PLEWA|nr:hypothetical protein NDU88_001225 [Pleurodeles waltl]